MTETIIKTIGRIIIALIAGGSLWAVVHEARESQMEQLSKLDPLVNAMERGVDGVNRMIDVYVMSEKENLLEKKEMRETLIKNKE